MNRQLPKILALSLLIFVALLTIGCGGLKVVLVKRGEVIRAGPNVRGRVYVLTDNGWTLSDNSVKIPEGWYIQSPPDLDGE